ncbi:FecR family protein [Sphingomonas azotifigens]|uniref:FecR family protein n=1 Tax=Sphingomonas azotifigens TaxID=330920 RepID=UPI0009FC0C31|nr:FecR domain-containing protein [Sphingomonas azotifigens]
MTTDSTATAAIATEAARWHERLAHNPDAAPPEAFERWRAADPAHAEAFAQVDAVHACARALATHPELLALRQATATRVAVHRARSAVRKQRTGAALAALALVALPLAGWYAAEHRTPASALASSESRLFSTGVGQRLSMMLDDGSRLTLNTATAVRVAYTPSERHLILERGQAWFEVAKGQPRPFRVTAGAHDVVAHGTAFDVRLDADRTTVLLVEGKVTVGAVAMVPNDLLVARGDRMTLRHGGDARQIEAWREGLVVFADTPLAEAVAELNRYAPHALLVKDARAGALRISGAFRTGESATFAEALETSFPVQAVTRSDGTIELSSRR